MFGKVKQYFLNLIIHFVISVCISIVTSQYIPQSTIVQSNYESKNVCEKSVSSYLFIRWFTVLFYRAYLMVLAGEGHYHEDPDSQLQNKHRSGSYSSLSSRGRHTPDFSSHDRNSPVPSLPRPRRHDFPERERRDRRELKKVRVKISGFLMRTNFC